MRKYTSVSDIPRVAAVYALYGGTGRGLYVAYVGVADNLKRRLRQHLIKKSSNVTSGTSAASLNPDYVTRVRWWEHPEFEDRPSLEETEQVGGSIWLSYRVA